MFKDPDGRTGGLENHHVLHAGCLQATWISGTGKVSVPASPAGCIQSLELPQAQPQAPSRLFSEFSTILLGQLPF